ncbi:MAG: hypothetical protein GTN81_03665, partial [Proteobacteria bacterium]|nr:hypothetical protein [Pseudomonadota bacterium]
EVALTPDAEEEAAEITKLSVSSTLGDSEDVEFRTVTVEEGDSIETIILREFGRVDEQLMDAVGEVNPEIEDLSKISAGQIIRLPDETVLALSTWAKVGGKEEEAIIWKAGREGKKDMPSLEGKEVPEPVFQETGQPARMEMGTGSAKSFRTEEEILIELGEIKEPAKEPEGEELFRETSVSALRKSSKREALEPLPADTPQEPLGGYEKPPSEPAVAVSGTVEGAPEKDLKDVRESPKKPRVAVESGKAAEKRPADTETESLVASADAETLEPSRETPRQDLQSVLPEKRREEFEGRLAATEEEVNRFFVSYVERYNRKDLEGFLELFSPRVVQNGTDNLHKIRKIYTDFFGQSELLNYHLEDTRIQIYQNAVKASANYRVEQIPRKGKKRRVWAGDVSWILVREDDTLKIVSLDYRHMTSPK